MVTIPYYVKNLSLAGLLAVSACSTPEINYSRGFIELSKIPKEHTFEAVHNGNYKPGLRIESDTIVERLEHRCKKEATLEYCILKKTIFEDVLLAVSDLILPEQVVLVEHPPENSQPD